MTGRKKDPLREITEEEQKWLERISRSQSEPASHVIRAKGVLVVKMAAAMPRQRNRSSGNAETRFRS